MSPRDALMVAVTTLGAFFTVRGLASIGPTVFFGNDPGLRVLIANLLGVLLPMLAGIVMIVIGVTGRRDDASAQRSAGSPVRLLAGAILVLGLYFVVQGVAGVISAAVRPDGDPFFSHFTSNEMAFRSVELGLGAVLALVGGIIFARAGRTPTVFADDSAAADRVDTPQG